MLKRRSLSKEISDDTKNPKLTKKDKIDFTHVISTGSTWLDLAISGTRREYGGVPAGIIMEIFGPEGSGKTAILSEMITSTQAREGEADIGDPEARLDKEYSRIYGANISKKNYFMPDTVDEIFNRIRKWTPKRTDVVNMFATDSLAALSTELELEKGDKMGMKRAKEFSQGFRIISREIKKKSILMACTNQMREGDHGETTPGGRATRYYSSLRMRVGMVEPIIVSKEIHGKKVERAIGINSLCVIKKSTIDIPYRQANIFIIFNYGIDDIRGNLQYIKTSTGDSMYDAIDKKYKSMNQAIRYIEENNMQKKLRKATKELWEEIENNFKNERRLKERF